MAQEETRKKKTGMARCLELASQHKGLVFISGILAAAAAVCSFLPYLSIYFIMRELIGVFPDMANANMSVVLRYGWMALGGIAGNVILYFCALMCSHLAAFGTLYELKLAFANHITEIPLGYHLTIGSGRIAALLDQNTGPSEQLSEELERVAAQIEHGAIELRNLCARYQAPLPPVEYSIFS